MVFKHARLIHLRTAHCAAVVGLSHETLVDEVDGEFLGGETRMELMNRPDVQEGRVDERHLTSYV